MCDAAGRCPFYVGDGVAIRWCDRASGHAGDHSKDGVVILGPTPPAPARGEVGFKDDRGKVDLTLLPWDALERVARIMEFGLRKGYPRHSWRRVEGGAGRYVAAGLRHVKEHLLGRAVDPESGLPHLDHAACDLLFACALAADAAARRAASGDAAPPEEP